MNPPTLEFEYTGHPHRLQLTQAVHPLTWTWPSREDAFFSKESSQWREEVFRQQLSPPESSVYIASLTGDPFSVGRVSVLLTTGAPLVLPLLPLSSPIDFTDGTSLYWSGGVSEQWGTDSTLPLGEVVVGELSAVLGVCGAASVPTHPESEASSVVTSLFRSVPYKVLWRSCHPNQLLVSLPLEECVECIVVPVPPTGPRLSRNAATKRRFPLPRGTVPLDIAETVRFSFLVVGTYSSGALVYDLDPSGGIHSVVRSVELGGCGSFFFPITSIVPLFPYNKNKTPEKDTDTRGKAEALSFLQKGALLCSSPYDPYAVVVKLLNGVVESNTSNSRITSAAPAFRAQDHRVVVAEAGLKLSSAQIATGEGSSGVVWDETAPSVELCELILKETPKPAVGSFTAYSSEPFVLHRISVKRVYEKYWFAAATNDNTFYLFVGNSTLGSLKAYPSLTLRLSNGKGESKDASKTFDATGIPRFIPTGVALVNAADDVLVYAVSHFGNCISLISLESSTKKQKREVSGGSPGNTEESD